MSTLSHLLPISPRIIGDQTVNAIDGRSLHAYLEVGKKFADWMPEQIDAFGFVEHVDFEVCFPNLGSEGRGGQNRKEYLLSIPMAKELAMVSRTQKGKQARLYFIECERMAMRAVLAPAFHVPQTLGEALRLAADLEEKRLALACEVQEMTPKAAFHDQVAASNDTLSVAELAKVLGTGETRLFRWLRGAGYLIPNSTLPYQHHIDQGLFRVVEKSFEDKHGRDRFFTKTLITGKGQIAIAKRFRAQGEAGRLPSIGG